MLSANANEQSSLAKPISFRGEMPDGLVSLHDSDRQVS
jgi:hypothetical protein